MSMVKGINNLVVGIWMAFLKRLEIWSGQVVAWWKYWQCHRALDGYRLPDSYKRIYFYHIRKTGGTSINHILLSLGGEEPKQVYDRVSNGPYFGTVSGDKVYAGWDRNLIERGKYFYAFSHIPQHKLSLPTNTFTFTCVREPAQRVLSLYKMLYNYKTNNVPHPGMKRQGKWLGNSFHDFLDRIPEEELLSQLYMFSSSFDIEEACENILDCDHVMFTERFDAGIDGLARKLNLELVPLHTRSAIISPPINESERDRLRKMLEPEYELYEKLWETLCFAI